MCGIFGIISSKEAKLSKDFLEKSTLKLLKLSENRGKDASGISFIGNNQLDVLKLNVKASKLKQTRLFKSILKTKLDNFENENFIVFGHCRMETNGSNFNHNNNQPVITNDSSLIHNGIIVNYDSIFQNSSEIHQEFDVDSEVISKILDLNISKGKSFNDAAKDLFSKIKGNASIAYYNVKTNKLLLGSNNGSLYIAKIENATFFASEKNMLMEVFKSKGIIAEKDIKQINNCEIVVIDLSKCIPEGTDFFYDSRNAREIIDHFADESFENTFKPVNQPELLKLENLLEDRRDEIKSLKRCSKCLIPESFPGISFDSLGVCSICNNWSPIKYKGKEALNQLLDSKKRDGKKEDVLIPLSGGRDSCFALDYLTEQGMKPVVYTYDWGMVTDLARRNISRMTSQLGLEHILISADIKKKRENIRKNVAAWLKRPSLGTIPLFMAGDKQFFYYANQLKKHFDLDLTIFGMNPLERTDFKVAYTGVVEKAKEDRHYHLSALNKLKIAAYYGKEYLLNPSYINSSLKDTFSAFLSYYFIEHNYEIFFEYYPWNENEINNLLINKYDWETAEDTSTTWRIGDGTASFYNYIYLNVSGFNENDTFRSNQIRQGLITREEAIKLVEKENENRFNSIKWYLETIGLDFESTIEVINSIPKLY